MLTEQEVTRALLHRALIRAHPHLEPALNALYQPAEEAERLVLAIYRAIDYHRMGYPLTFSASPPGAYYLAGVDHAFDGQKVRRWTLRGFTFTTSNETELGEDISYLVECLLNGDDDEAGTDRVFHPDS